MPEQTPPRELPHESLEESPTKLGTQSISDALALTLVEQTFASYESFRANNHDRRWQTHDNLYFGYVPQKVWEGTNIPRASLSVPISFDQIESAFPLICQAMFGVDPYWFQVEAEPGGSPMEARQIRAALAYALEHNRPDFAGSARIDLRMAIRSGLQYGNGGVIVEWDQAEQRPMVAWIDLRDLYVDPGALTPLIDDNRSIIIRRMMTVDQLNQLKERDPRFHIPALEVLNYLAANAPSAFGDQTKRYQEAGRGVQYSPGQSDYPTNPADRRVEVLIYYSRQRVIWVLSRKVVAYNERNPYGFIPLCFFPCFPVTGRFYAQSYSDVLEGNQRYIEALMNGRLDEISLALHPPRVMKRSGFMTPTALRWRPGLIMQAEDAKDVATLQVQNVTANVAGEVAWLEAAAEKRTGLNALATQGVPTPSNANRSATGVAAQQQGGASRLHQIVENIEDYLIVPMLYKMYKIYQYHTQPGELLPALGPDGQLMQVGAEAFNAPIRFKMTAASRMISQAKLAQMFPFVMNFLAQGPLAEQLHSVGKTVDWDEIFQMMQDATGTRGLYRLVRPMTAEEQKAFSQPKPDAQLEMQKAQLEAQTRLQMGQMKAQGDQQKAQLDAQTKQYVADEQSAREMLKLIAEREGDPMEAERERQKMILEGQKAKQKMVYDQLSAGMKIKQDMVKHQLDMMLKKDEMATDAQLRRQEMMMSQAEGEQALRQQEESHQMQMRQGMQGGMQKMTMAGLQGQQKLAHGEATNREALEQQRRTGRAKVDLLKQQAKVKGQGKDKKPNANG